MYSLKNNCKNIFLQRNHYTSLLPIYYHSYNLDIMRRNPCNCCFCNSNCQNDAEVSNGHPCCSIAASCSPQCSHEWKILGAIKQHLWSQNKIKATILKIRYLLSLWWYQLFSMKVKFLHWGQVMLDSIQGSSKDWRNYQIAMFYFVFWCGASCNLSSFPGFCEQDPHFIFHYVFMALNWLK